MDDDFEEGEVSISLTQTVLETTLSSIGIIINVSALVYIVLKRDLRPLTIILWQIYLMNTLFCLGVLMTGNTSGVVFSICMPLVDFGAFCTQSFLCLLAIQRFIAVRFPIYSNQYSTKRATVKQVVSIYCVFVALVGVLEYLKRIDPGVRRYGFAYGVLSTIVAVSTYGYIGIHLFRTRHVKNETSQQSSRNNKALMMCASLTMFNMSSVIPPVVSTLTKSPHKYYFYLFYFLDLLCNPLVYFYVEMQAKKKAKKKASRQANNIRVVQNKSSSSSDGTVLSEIA